MPKRPPDPTRIAENGRALVCLGCGERVMVELPMRVSVFVALTRAFVQAHQRCPVPSVDPERYADSDPGQRIAPL